MKALWIDRWYKYIWLARSDDFGFVQPIWYIENNSESIIYISGIVWQYNISKIAIWKPKDLQVSQKIIKFSKQIYISTDIQPDLVDENYTTTIAKNITWIYTKSTINDVVAAMEILKRYLAIVL